MHEISFEVAYTVRAPKQMMVSLLLLPQLLMWSNKAYLQSAYLLKSCIAFHHSMTLGFPQVSECSTWSVSLFPSVKVLAYAFLQYWNPVKMKKIFHSSLSVYLLFICFGFMSPLVWYNLKALCSFYSTIYSGSNDNDLGNKFFASRCLRPTFHYPLQLRKT